MEVRSCSDFFREQKQSGTTDGLPYQKNGGLNAMNVKGIGLYTTPSFVGKVWTKEELMESVNRQVQSNQNKKMSLTDMVKSTYMGTREKFRFVGEDKIYAFDEYIKELDKRSKNNG